jgi:hypothetical protein
VKAATYSEIAVETLFIIEGSFDPVVPALFGRGVDIASA